jgi:3',5'-cyclic AMP phosphodiesterase CpdA
MKIVATADTHGLHERLVISDVDVLNIAGDICPWGSMEDVLSFGQWLRKLPHAPKVVIAGNHDKPFERYPVEAVQAMPCPFKSCLI